MAAPYTGPFESGRSGHPDVMDFKIWNRQAKPYNTVLSYFHDGGWGDGGRSWSTPPFDPVCQDIATLKMRNELRDKIFAARSSLLLTVKDAKPSFDMVVRRSGDVLDWINMARKGDIGGMFRKAGLTGSSARRFQADWRSGAKNAGDLFLETVFGWMPLIKDLNEAVKALDTDFSPYHKVEASRAHSRIDVTRDVYVNGEERSVSTTVQNHKVRVGSYVTISVEDASLATLNQLGFVNLPQVAWDSIPLSYMVDWVIPINQFIQQFSDFVGLREDLPGTAVKGRTRYSWDYSWSSPSSSSAIKIAKERKSFQRHPGVATASLPHLKDLTGLNPFQGGVVVSMMTQGFGNMPRPRHPDNVRKEHNWGWERRY